MRAGVLQPVPESFVEEERATSKSWRNHEAWEPDWIQGDFLCILTCRKGTCDHVRVVGHSAVEATGNWEWEGEQYEHRLTPTMFFPALPLLEIRPLCPKEVGERVDFAAKIIWLDPNSAANRIRSAVEALMDEQGIIRYMPDRRGSRRESASTNESLRSRQHCQSTQEPLTCSWPSSGSATWAATRTFSAAVTSWTESSSWTMPCP